MKKYLRFTCTVCKRYVDKLVDITHYTPDQCTITLGCEGRLQPVVYRSTAGIAVAPETGVTDWRPRGSTVTGNPALVATELVNLQTGSLKQLVLALPIDTPLYELTLSLKADTPKAYRQYVFRKEQAFTTVSGVESGLEKKALRFTAYGATPDVVEVYVNGVKREMGIDPEDYQVYDGSGTSAAPPNTIVFNSSINETGVTQVDIIVSKEQTTTTIPLTFKRNVYDESRVSTGAYENVSYVDRLVDGDLKRYYLYTLDLDDASIPLNSILIPPADLDAMFLLATAPYTQLDRYTEAVLLLEDMSAERDYIKFYSENGDTTARATDTAITTIFPPLRLGKFQVEKTIKTATAGVEEQLVIDGSVIIGPDA